jgi:quaternary ammonium compound-resistance protein SugE
MKTAWIFLLVAGIAEWGWPVGLKLGWGEAGAQWAWIAFAILCMGISGWLLFLAQRKLPMGTAYAVWTGIGAVGTFLIGIAVFGDSAAIARFLCVGLIVGGILGLKFITK